MTAYHVALPEERWTIKHCCGKPSQKPEQDCAKVDCRLDRSWPIANGRFVARGHNLRVQSGDPTAHAETVCIRNAGRRRDWPELTVVSTLSPCIMCTGTALLYRIPRVVVGENRNFMGAEDLFRQRGVKLVLLDDPECIQMMEDFIRTHSELWNEDIGSITAAGFAR